VHSWLKYFIRAFVAFENSPLFFKLNRDKVKLKILQSNFFARIFSGTIFTPGAGAAKGLNFFQNPKTEEEIEQVLILALLVANFSLSKKFRLKKRSFFRAFVAEVFYSCIRG